MITFTPSPCVAPSDFSRLEAKQGHAKSAKAAKRARFSAFSLLKFRIPRVSASRNRGAHFAFPNQIPPFRPASAPRTCPDPVGALVGTLRPLRAKARPGTAGREQSAFTLVELLAVIGIMGLLAAVGVPALKGLTGSGGRKQALSQLMGALEIARNTAISTRTNAAVIFPDSTFASGDAYKYRSMAVVAWNATNSTNPATMIGSWIVLPQGVAFFPNSLRTANLPTVTNISVRILTTKLPEADFPGVVFQSDGALDEGLFPVTQPLPSITFFEGTVDGTAPNRTSKTTIFETVGLTRYTGRTIPTVVTNAP